MEGGLGVGEAKDKRGGADNWSSSWREEWNKGSRGRGNGGKGKRLSEGGAKQK